MESTVDTLDTGPTKRTRKKFKAEQEELPQEPVGERQACKKEVLLLVHVKKRGDSGGSGKSKDSGRKSGKAPTRSSKKLASATPSDGVSGVRVVVHVPQGEDLEAWTDEKGDATFRLDPGQGSVEVELPDCEDFSWGLPEYAEEQKAAPRSMRETRSNKNKNVNNNN